MLPRNKVTRSLLFLALAITTVVILHASTYKSLNDAKYSYIEKLGSSGRRLSTYGSQNLVVYNKKFDDAELERLLKENSDIYANHTLVGVSGKLSGLSEVHTSNSYQDYDVKVFGSETNKQMCKDVERNVKLSVSGYDRLEDQYEKMARILLEQLRTELAMQDLKPFFKDLEKFISDGVVDTSLFKFSGTSVWLEEYGIHFMVSRVLFSMKRYKKAPNLSLVYAQAFDENWKEIDNVDIIVPSNDPATGLPKKQTVTLPRFLPIPFYVSSKYLTKRFYGPEDPRMILVKNSHGSMEPVIIYNSYHRKVDKEVSKEEKEFSLSFSYYRSMFMAWPFRFQMGKRNMDGMSNPSTDGVIYNRAVELMLGKHREKVQKNWTPFISIKERNPYDRNLYFVYRWTKMEILKCSLEDLTNGVSSCKYDYVGSKDMEETAVGPLRGGTQMVSLNNFIDLDEEVWFGFARAHLSYCGCGSGMYRPNLVTIIKSGDRYKIGHISSYMSFNIPVDGWSVPEMRCAERNPSALIPNGISLVSKDSKNDYATLTLSVADASVHVIHFENLVSIITKMAHSMSKDTGYNDMVAECAIVSSKEYCKKYGEDFLSTLNDT